jgi:N-methylhydantoinase A/oxoprolinase/acetone carboxylase beta subunit
MEREKNSHLTMGIDIGGTFTDIVVYDERTKGIHVKKILSTPEKLEMGVLSGISKILDVDHLQVQEIKRIIHGATVATNAILEKKGAEGRPHHNERVREDLDD